MSKTRLAPANVTRYVHNALHLSIGDKTVTAAERMKAMRQRRRSIGVREVRLNLPDARASLVKKRIAGQVAMLSRKSEDEALNWIEAVSEFDKDAAR